MFLDPSVKLPDFLPGMLTLRRGAHADYAALARYHYLSGPPATWAGIWTIDYADAGCKERVRPVAVGVLSYPVPSSRPRERHLRLPADRRVNVMFANKSIRTVSRVIVHPQFRALGLSTALVRCICHHCPVRYVEAMARMGNVCPFFERGGMTRVPATDPDEVAYFIFDRHADPADRVGIPVPIALPTDREGDPHETSNRPSAPASTVLRTARTEGHARGGDIA